MRKWLPVFLVILIIFSLVHLYHGVSGVKEADVLVDKLHQVDWRNRNSLDNLNDQFEPIHANLLTKLANSNDYEVRLMSAYLLTRNNKKEYDQYLYDSLRSEDSQERAMASSLLCDLWVNEAGPLARQGLYDAQKLIQKGKLDQAINRLTLIIHEDPGFAEAYNQRAMLFYLKGDYVKAIADCRSAVNLNPDHFGAYSGMGESFLGLRDYGNAMVSFKKALDISPHENGTRQMLNMTQQLLQRKLGVMA